MKKFIIVMGMVVCLFAVGAYAYFNSPRTDRNQYVVKDTTLDDVLGTSTENKKLKEGSSNQNRTTFAAPFLDSSSKTFQGKFDEIKKEAEKVDIAEVASSSPQVQKILNDLKTLENAPKDQVKQSCQQICNSL